MLQLRLVASWWRERHIYTSVLAAWRQSAGESDPIKKNPEEDPWVRSGTQVSQGWGFGFKKDWSCRIMKWNAGLCRGCMCGAVLSRRCVQMAAAAVARIVGADWLTE